MQLVILDLDETLIHACDEWIGRKYDFLAADKMIFVRPFAKELVSELLSKYKVAVWTASYGKYTSDIIANLFESSDSLEFVWDRCECELKSHPNETEYFVKDLNKVLNAGWVDGSYCVVDDRPEYLIGSLESVISVKPYFGAVEDKALPEVLRQIESWTPNDGI